MNQRAARERITELKKIIRSRYPSVKPRIGPQPYGDANDVFLYTYATDDLADGILKTASPHVMDILLDTGVLVHMMILDPGTMMWLWNGKKKSKEHRVTRRATTKSQRATPRVAAESRAAYRTAKAHRGMSKKRVRQ